MTTANSAPTYTLASNEAMLNTKSKKNKHRHHHQKPNVVSPEDPDPTDGNGSLTYSAASSVHSGGSAAGESTDSSFADIMRVLDLQDSKELAALIKKEGVSSAGELREKRGFPRGGASVASSLNYSTDGESALEGAKLLQTIAGQPSDSYAFDGGGGRHNEEPISDSDILFAPAAPADHPSKRKKDKKRRDKQQGVHSNSMTTPKAKNSSSGRSSPSHRRSFETGSAMDSGRSSPVPVNKISVSENNASSTNNKPGTPPPLPPKGVVEEDEEDIWYAKWWMSCFPDSFKNLMPKR